jgi:hypothetical protein
MKICYAEASLWVYLGAEEAKFTGRALGPEAIGEVERRSSAGGHRGDVCRKAGTKSTEGEKARSFIEAETEPQLAGGGSEDAAAESRVEDAETVHFDRDGGLAGSGADRPAPSADGLSGE